MSLRLRLTLLYSIILALTLIIFSVAVRFAVPQITQNFLKDTLQAEAKRLTTVRSDPQGIVDSAKRHTTPQMFVQTRTIDGVVITGSNEPNFTLPISTTALQHAQSGHSKFDIAPVNNERLLIYTAPIEKYGKVTGIVQVARSLDNLDRMLNTLQSILIIGSSLATVMAFGIGWVLAGTALRPINRITQTAYDIGAERDFGRRVDYTGPQDEVGRLSTTFNTMLSELETSYHQVEQSLQTQRRFVADASHELRTPLTTIRGNLGLLQRDPPIDDEDRIAVVNDMVEESDRLIRLVNELLALARADAGRPLRSESVAVRPLVEDMARRVHTLYGGRDIDYSHIQDVAIIGDLDALRQVILILLDNAFKFTPSGGTITITSTLANDCVAIRIRDTGAGVAPDVIPHLFERFYRGDEARSGNGTGLGLSIAKTLIEAQQGTITFESRLGYGSVVTIILPVSEERGKAESGT
ncbi:MAG: hypothetical protein GFH27_549287n185 [Chloroflexi bacterium AL-W]|nr:hypothetical protein [Chloroflexi bacterium AL-N1]NOK66459.1 hypothetical protein [Chloroflexi bacterium AL-N10]NOK71847.1 hypothetical protein [Chloroflexi bacterium AL-N5]NOK81104.1 hypothetical protein [Chloroflexi bacterium AL-W]NOK89377.1 hypothetical protein [Chloroflexi bacterium AL-N15]